MTDHPPLATLTDHELDTTIAHLRSLNRHAFLDYALTVGQYLVERFFHGRFDAVHDRDPTKQHSFNQLMLRREADLQELGMTAGSLRRYIAAAEVAHDLPESTRRQLGLDHMTRLAAVADIGERKRLAHDAATLHWTRAQVAIAVRLRRQPKSPYLRSAKPTQHRAADRQFAREQPTERRPSTVAADEAVAAKPARTDSC